ncbi:MAG: hypothetical protein SVY53_10735 [Chloroflexota bacterium]|nr:hypothetical protein [Chloroflexota bacterium]
MNIYEIIKVSFSKAISMPEQQNPIRELHRERSKRWINCLGEELSKRYPVESNFRVFWRGNTLNRKEFGFNELLYDISVCEVAFTESVLHKNRLTLLRNVVWQVESEFAKDSHQSVIDFNKLVAGSGSNKLFVAPTTSMRDQFLRVLREAASFCSGNIYLALVPPPSEWPSDSCRIETLVLEQGVWVKA